MRSYRDIILGEAAFGGMPAAYYPLDKAGDLGHDAMNDITGAGFNASAGAGSPAFAAVGPTRPAKSYTSFNGSSYLVTSSSPIGATTALSFSGWINISSSSATYAGVFGAMDYTTSPHFHGYGLFINGNPGSGSGLQFMLRNEANSGVNFPFTYNRWAFVVGTYDGSQATDADRAKVWVDGIPQTITVATAVPTSLTATSGGLRIGGVNTGNNLTGGLAHLALWPYALTTDRVDAVSLKSLRGINDFLEAA